MKNIFLILIAGLLFSACHREPAIQEISKSRKGISVAEELEALYNISTLPQYNRLMVKKKGGKLDVNKNRLNGQ